MQDNSKLKLTVSVIIPTKNRPGDLDLTVQTLLQQSVLPEELLIVDQSTDDESSQRVHRLMDRYAPGSMQLKYVHDSRLSGGAAARNRAMAMATSEVWLFLDDDVCLEPNFVEELLAAYHSYPQAVGVSGIVTNYPRPAVAFQLWNRIFVCGPFRDDRQPVYWNAEQLRSSPPVRVSRLGAGLMSFRADAVRDIRFDENLSGVSDGEDVDFCSRIGGRLLIIVPQARLVHKLSPAGRSRQHWLNRHARSNHFLYRKNWSSKAINRASFAWLNAGYFLVAGFASLRAASLTPWRDLMDGIRQGHRAGLGTADLKLERTAEAVEETSEETVNS